MKEISKSRSSKELCPYFRECADKSEYSFNWWCKSEDRLSECRKYALRRSIADYADRTEKNARQTE